MGTKGRAQRKSALTISEEPQAWASLGAEKYILQKYKQKAQLQNQAHPCQSADQFHCVSSFLLLELQGESHSPSGRGHHADV